MTKSVTGTAHVAANADGMAAVAAEFIASRIDSARGSFRLVLAGGTTPRGLYRILSTAPLASQIPWAHVDLLWGDERFVPADHKDSNFRMVRETLLANGNVVPREVFPIPTDTAPDDCALRYESTLQEMHGSSAIGPGNPLFDCVLLGIGTDGHIASLLPHQSVLDEQNHWVAAVPHGRETPRITLTYPALNSTRCTMFLASGANKSQIVARARAGDTTLPAARLKPQGDVHWFLDSAAAG